MDITKDQVKSPISKEVKKEIEKQLKKIGTIRPHKGHDIFKISKDTLEITEPKWRDPIVAIDRYTKKTIVKKSIEAEEGFFYLSALNAKNCKKKIIQMLGITKADLENLEKEVLKSKEEKNAI